MKEENKINFKSVTMSDLKIVPTKKILNVTFCTNFCFSNATSLRKQAGTLIHVHIACILKCIKSGIICSIPVHTVLSSDYL